VSQSALSQTVRSLEERLGLRLLARTTRSVAPTDAGERLLQSVGPRIDGINQDLAALGEMRDKPAGMVRITADENAARTILWPAIKNLLPAYPDVKVEVVIDYGLTDIVADGYDAGVRLGGMIAKDMIAIPIGPEMRMATVGSTSYFASRPAPVTPQDLTGHACINLRLPTYGGLYAWEYEKGKREVRVRVDGQLVFNSISMIIEAARSGFGLAHMTEGEVQADLDSGRLVRVLAGWCPPFSGFISIIPAAASHPRHSRCSSKPCATED
jgi:DNA-binding transcriptional LysR family regulator